MPAARFESLVGTIDGVNTVFTVPMLYTTGTTSVFVNGSPIDRLSWDESSPATGEITFEPLVYTPAPGDVLAMYFLTNALPEVVVTDIDGTITVMEPLEATIEEVEDFDAELEEIP